MHCSKQDRPEKRIAGWLDEDEPALLALDAPLGWPVDMQRVLPSHVAGAAVNADLDTLFNRMTDRFVRNTYGQTPLEVGANLIARTAVAALAMLQAVREWIGCDIPLAWDSATLATATAIEVYPAATLLAHGVRKKSMKDRSNVARRKAITSFLADTFVWSEDLDVDSANGHVLDAAVCAVAGIDFLVGNVRLPPDPGLARLEGWIWVRKASMAQAGEDWNRLVAQMHGVGRARRRHNADGVTRTLPPIGLRRIVPAAGASGRWPYRTPAPDEAVEPPAEIAAARTPCSSTGRSR